MKYMLIAVLGVVCTGCSMTGGERGDMPPVTMNLWPDRPVTSAAERVTPNKKGNVLRITDITAPSFTVYRADTKDPAPSILVFPGGGYSILAYDKEGTEIAEWLNTIGITAVVVKYTVPNNRTKAFQDGQRTMRLVRHHAKHWNIDPKRIGVLGFSAGGHLCARLSTDAGNKSYAKVDKVDETGCRPDFCVLVYPAYLQDKQTRQVATELPVSADTPPTFIVQTEDDGGFIAGTKAYGKALKDAGVPATFHFFAKGGHGYGLRPSEHEVSRWPDLCEEWLRANSILPRVNEDAKEESK